MRAAPSLDRAWVRGACPSAATPFPTGDGELLRVRLPGGDLPLEGLRALAAVARATGHALELTARANVQVRGLGGASVPPAAWATDVLIAAGVVLGPPHGLDADARRNILASPTAGIDPAEVFDVSPTVRRLAAALATADLEISPKLGVIVDGGGSVGVRDRRQDLCFAATASGGWAVTVGRALAGAEATVVADGPEAALCRLLGALRASGARSGADLAEARGQVWVEEHVAGTTGRTTLGPASPLEPIGLFRQRDGALAVGAAPVLGRLAAETADAVADAVGEVAGARLRTTPWRGLLVLDVPAAKATALLERFAVLGLVVDASDPALGVVACTGDAGCHAGLGDALGLAADAIDRRRAARGHGAAAPGPLHVTGCEKRCAARGDAATTLLAQEPNAWRVVPPGAWAARADHTPMATAHALEAVAPGVDRG